MSKRFNVGDHVSGLLKWSNYVKVSERHIKRMPSRSYTELELLASLGPLGISGLTAYTGFDNIGNHVLKISP